MNKQDLNQLFRGTGYVKKLTHPDIYKDLQYDIIAYHERNGKYGPFFHLWCRIHMNDGSIKYQKIFSNHKITDMILLCSTMTNYNHYEDEDTDIYYLDKDAEPRGFFAGEIMTYKNITYREVYLF